MSSDGEARAERTVTRIRMADGVRHRALTVTEDGVNGSLYLPPEGAPPAAPVLLFGGSEGGNSVREVAALLASRGHASLALCYFGCEGRPEHLEEIRMEYFVEAAKLLEKQDGAVIGKMAVMGWSRGSEAAQLLGQHHPELVEDVVAFASSNVTYSGYPDTTKAGWTRNGEPLYQEQIPLDEVRGTVLGVVGGDDQLWSAEYLSEGIAEEHRLLVYEKAGHYVGGPPYLPEYTVGPRVGGTRAANAASRADSWPEVLKLVRN